MFSPLPVLLLAVTAQASQLAVQSLRLTVVDRADKQLRTEEFSFGNKLQEPVDLSATDGLKLTFQIADKESGDGLQPQQTFLRFFDTRSGEEGIQPVRVTTGGKAKFELSMAKPPQYLPPTPESAPLKVSLIIGSSIYTPVQHDLFDLILPRSHPAPFHPDEESFHPRPAIAHTFRPEQKVPPRLASAVFAAGVIAPWLVLLRLWSQVAPRVSHLLSFSVVPFIITLGAFEGLLLWYWVELSLGQVLQYGACLALLTIFAGRYALASIGKHNV